jgi:hypothetical protein
MLSLAFALSAYKNSGSMHGGIWMMIITPLAFLVIGYIISIVRFNKEINKTEKFFTRLLEAQPIITKPVV